MPGSWGLGFNSESPAMAHSSCKVGRRGLSFTGTLITALGGQEIVMRDPLGDGSDFFKGNWCRQGEVGGLETALQTVGQHSGGSFSWQLWRAVEGRPRGWDREGAAGE